MSTLFYIIIAILIFGILIATHELGHFAAAKGLGVKVNEYSIGMGPLLFSRQKGETLYSLRLFPIGGFCAMEGEDEESEDPRAFGNAAGWKKLIILVAGAGMNFLTGVLILLCLNIPAQGFVMPTIAGFTEGFGLEDCGIHAGDQVLAVDGHRMFSYSNLSLFLSRAGDTVKFEMKGEDGEKYTLDIYMPYQDRMNEEGEMVHQRGLMIGTKVLPGTVLNKIRFTIYDAVDYVRLVWVSLGDLVTGHVGLRDLSGMVGITETIAEVGSNPDYSPNAMAAVMNIASLAALIAVNLAVMNLLPLPALDGGRVFFLVLNGILYLLFRRTIDPKYEGFIHTAGLAALMLLMVVVTVSDIGKLFGV